MVMWLWKTGVQTNQYLYKYLVESNRKLYWVLSKQPPWLSLSLYDLVLTINQARLANKAFQSFQHLTSLFPSREELDRVLY